MALRKRQQLRVRDWRVYALVLIEAVLCFHYLTSHPVFVREEWQFLYRVHTQGAFHADPVTASMRPLVVALYALLYPAAYMHSSAMHVIPALVTAAIAVALYKLLLRFTSQTWAFLAASLWLVVPTHVTLDHWLAVTNVGLSAFCALLGTLLLDSSDAKAKRVIGASFAFALSILFYEASILLVVMAAVVILRYRVRVARRTLVAFVVVAAAPALFALVANGNGRKRVWISPLKAIYRNFGVVTSWPTAAFVVAIVLLAVIVYSVARPIVQKRAFNSVEQLTAAGLVVAIVGFVPFLGYGVDAMFAGVGDRANYFTSIGVAVSVVGLAQIWINNRFAGQAMLTCLTFGLVPLHVERSMSFTRATHSVVNAGNAVIAQLPTGGGVDIEEGHGYVPKADLGLDAATELRLYLESDWKHNPVKVTIAHSDSSRMVSQGAEIEPGPASQTDPTAMPLTVNPVAAMNAAPG